MALRLLLMAGLLVAINTPLVHAGHAFDFFCRSDTVQYVQPGEVVEYHFSLVNTGTERDVYELDCRVISIVPDWVVSYCTRFG
ncbi:MAG: hypothetical protein ABIK43_00085 [candidate division WOR-3 bacterium]